VLAEEASARHRFAFPDRPVNGSRGHGGQYQWRSDGEYHLFNPQTIHKLQLACRTNNYKVFKEYSELVNNQARNLCTLPRPVRVEAGPHPSSTEDAEGGWLRSHSSKTNAPRPVPIEEVEPI